MVSPFKALALSWKVCDKDKKQASSVSVLSVQLREQKEKGRTQEEVPRRMNAEGGTFYRPADRASAGSHRHGTESREGAL